LKEHTDKEPGEMRYLLGALSAEEQARFEERYFVDDAAFEEIEIAEDELIDAYVRRELSPSERERFEQVFLRSERLIERVKFARTLTASVGSRSSVTPQPVADAKSSWWKGLLSLSFAAQPTFRASLALGALILVIGGAALIVQWTRLRDESRRLEGERAELQRQQQDLARVVADTQSKNEQSMTALKDEQARLDKLIEELHQAQTSQPTAPQTILSMTLFPGGSRGSGATPAINAKSGTSALQLKLVLEQDEYPSYLVTVKAADGSERFKKELKIQHPRAGPVISIQLPVKSLSSGDYTVAVSGRASSGNFESVADYPFQLVKK
jgi:hypothetical protein